MALSSCLHSLKNQQHIPERCYVHQGQRTFGNEASRGRKEQILQNEVASLEAALDSAKAELEKIGSRNRKVSYSMLLLRCTHL